MVSKSAPPSYASTHKVRENDGSTGWWCIDKAVLAREPWYPEEGIHQKQYTTLRLLQLLLETEHEVKR